MEELLLELLTRLEVVGDRDESMYDTVVREKMGEAIFYAFIRPEAGYVVPDDYEMPADENKLIKAALQAYIDGANFLARNLRLDTFHERLAAFQNGSVCTDRKSYFDDFFGWWNPKFFDESGNSVVR